MSVLPRKTIEIEDIIIKHNYESKELREELINYLTDICVNHDNRKKS